MRFTVRKGARDNSAHRVLALEHRPRLAADFVKLFYGNYIFVSGNLKNAVGRGVNNGLAGCFMLAAVVKNYLCAAVGFVAKNLKAGGGGKSGKNIIGKPVGR